MNALWTSHAMAAAMGAESAGMLPEPVTGLSIDSRSIRPGEAFFAIKGDAHDGHDFAAAALRAGAALAVVAPGRVELPADAPLLVVGDVLDGLIALAGAARARSHAKIVAVTGSVGKTSTKEALRLALGADGETHASVASFNNHWGVPLSLARLPASARYGVFEIGMNHAGEITPLTRLLRPHIAIVTTVAPVHLEYFGSEEAIADAKAEILLGIEPGGTAVLNRDNRHFQRLLDHAARSEHALHVVSFGEHELADARLLACSLRADCSTVEADILGERVTYKIGAPGRHLVDNSLAVLATASLAGADLALAALALAEQAPAAGRGARIALEVPGGTATVIDESYNANPVSMRAALALLGASPVGARGRRIAVLGDMLELGPAGRELHRDLAQAVIDNDVDLVFCAGPLMHELWQALPSERRGGYAQTAAALQGAVLSAVANGDVIMIKGSNGSRMGPIVKELARHFTTPEPAQG
ncbi:UDP-N-acetylmuramoylalanyl-D-glutamyl-2,6-diaminopimelate--D-alanyl-D-alanine ligase [Xanthobacteraceae bacterium Astr-EGSB]|uniref:UDP-N-acetylmuramoylalanyl-D-glutamyl-2, 6-diaminopimelate--D-alanyl-D-alanine ligase n=1 Tax=Astrobacterium formosum TaxID=3069710 RepID=UPI0027B13461|nr:UDP-N-acetylmuramoylalanyl-D-glutamyl-2,6-diaminopimelate--D-alanyl-D-alanine ligase [Xanthobacteraceae bacterium Astr-EGSB]